MLLSRVAVLQALENEKDPVRIYRAQGKAFELRALAGIPTWVEESIKSIEEEEKKQEKETKRDEHDGKRPIIW